MSIKIVSARDASEAVGPYAQALEVFDTSRRLYISGQPPVDRHGIVPTTFTGQAETVWQNIVAQLRAANMSVENLVKVTSYLTDRSHIMENRDVRKSFLGNHTPALTVVLAGMFDESWLLEIEAIAEQ